MPRHTLFSRARRPVLVAVVLVALAAAVPPSPVAAGSSTTVYETDFSDPAATAPEWGFTDGRTTESENGSTFTMEPGAYTMALDGIKNLWSGPDIGRLPVDQIVETTIEEMSGDPQQIAGVVCRGDVVKNKGYGFFIGADGYYSIGTFGSSGARIVANKSGNERTDAVDPDGPNALRAECTSVGKTKVRLTFSVNGEKVASVVDRTSTSKIGRWAYVISEVNEGETASVTFSSFRIARP